MFSLFFLIVLAWMSSVGYFVSFVCPDSYFLSCVVLSVSSVEIDGSFEDSDGLKESASKKRYFLSFHDLYDILEGGGEIKKTTISFTLMMS